MRPDSAIRTPATRVAFTAIPDSWAWMRVDMVVRLVPFAAAYGVASRLTGGARWLGWSAGDLRAQLGFAAVGVPLMFVAAAAVQLWLTRRRAALNVPGDRADASFQAAFYAVNGPVEEAFFRGLVQGGLGAAVASPPAGFAVATAAYILYHRFGRWAWPDVFATALLGVPVGLAYWLLPGPPSLLGVSLVHVAATCGFLGPGPYLLRRLRLV